jgi:hypothetical protein
VCIASATSYGADDQEGLFAICNFRRKKCFPRFVGEVFGAGEEAEEWAALEGIVIADCAAEHGIAGFEFIEDRAESGRSGEFERDLAVHVSQCAEMGGENDANHGRLPWTTQEHSQEWLCHLGAAR